MVKEIPAGETPIIGQCCSVAQQVTDEDAAASY
jgi:hypothetical protein